MADPSDLAEERLLPRKELDGETVSPARSSGKRVLEMAMGLIFATWVAFIFLLPSTPVTALYEYLIDVLGETAIGTLFLLFSGPILVLTILAIAGLVITGSREAEHVLMKRKPAKYPKLRFWTIPVLVDGPFGVVAAAELVGFCLFVAYVVWAISAYTFEDLSTLSTSAMSPKEKSVEMWEYSGEHLGVIGNYCLAFLFLPVSRGSALLRLAGIPFEQAVRYHVWLGHLTMMIFTVHGLCYATGWAIANTLLEELTSWVSNDTAVIPGIIALSAGLLMWVTSLPPVRKKKFEAFFYTHHLYIVFILFLALHNNDYILSIPAGGILLFMMDRFLRFWQSRRTVNVVSVMRFPCGIIELILSKPPKLQYNALSFVFLQIREVSRLQWHPFSVSSSPLDGKNHLSVLIKVSGDWTAKLDSKISAMIGALDRGENMDLQSLTITASVEGPYGHEIPYHLTYENLILVAGGIGISPFVAIMRDILHRTREGKPCLPSNVLLIWAIKKSNELPVLSTLVSDIWPASPGKLKIEVDIYITRESEPSLEEGNGGEAESDRIFPVPNGDAMSVLVGTGSNLWFGLYVMSTAVGFVALMSLVGIYYIIDDDVSIWWYRGLLLLIGMVVSVIVFGGFVIILWSRWEKRTSKSKHCDDRNEQQQNGTPMQQQSDDQSRARKSFGPRRVFYGSRPNFQDIFESVSDQWVDSVDIGVIVCGPTALETSVAKECRSRSTKWGSDNGTVFHFHSHTFNL